VGKISMVDSRQQYESIAGEVDSAIRRVFDRGRFELGPEKRAFEEEFATFCGARYAVGVGNGTDALEIALRAYGIGPGDEVITVPNSCLSTTAAISHAGAKFVLVDIDERTYNLDPDQVESYITPSTKAIMPVHMYGHPAEMDTIKEIAARHNLRVIEDAALSTGARYKGQRTGSLGDAACFSFAPPKILGAYGDAGMIVTNDEHFAVQAKLWSSYGQEGHPSDAPLLDKLDHLVEGRHSHMDELQAAILRVKLPFVDDWVMRRREIAALYNKLLADLDVVLPYEDPAVRHAYRNYTIRVRDRNVLRRTLAAEGVASGILYSPPTHLQTVYEHRGFKKGDYPMTERVSEELLNLPVHSWLTNSKVKRVADIVRKHVEKRT
jgi:dTDP-4-amino-4,6-dideoxygalactose transaminase